MRVGLTTSVIDHGRSGEGQYVLGLVRALLEHTASHEFVLFVLERDLPLFDFVGHRMSLVCVGEEYRRPTQDFLWHQFALPRLARELRLDVVHVPSHRRMLWRRPCQLVTTIHDLVRFHIPPVSAPRAEFGRRALVRRLAQRQDAIIAVSRVTAADVRRFLDVPPNRIAVVPNGVDHARFSPGPREADSRLILERYDLRPPYFLYVAPLEHPTKNHVRLISAFNLFKTLTPSPWQLVLLGADGRNAEVVHDAVARSPYALDIHCPGFAPAEDLPAWYRTAGALVYPTLFEGFGLPPLEAMASGCPVLASERGAVAEICGGAALFTKPDDVNDIREQLARLAFDPELRLRLSEAGLRHVRHFDWAKTATAVLELYARVARRANTPILAPPVLSASPR